MKTRASGRRLRLIASLLGAALVGPSLALPARAAPGDGDAENADPSVEASERFRRGVKLYKDADFVAALVEFKRAYELEPNYRVLYNLGQTSSGLQDYAAALQAFEQYLDEGGKEIAGARRKEVESSIEELKNKVGTLTITTNVEGAEIQIDDVVVGVSPLDEPVLVNVGRRRIVATLTGHSPARRVLEVAGTDELDVELELINLEAAEGAAPTPTPEKHLAPRPAPGQPVAGIIALSVTGVSAVVTGILGGLALSAQGDLDDALAAFPGDPTAIQDAQSETDMFATATDVMLGVTSALAITTVVLFIVDPGSGSGAEGSKESTRGVALSLSPSPTGVWLNGSF